MSRQLLSAIGLLFVVMLPLACDSGTPATPTVSTTSSVASDGSTLKVSAPSLVSPVNGQALNTRQPVLAFQRASGQFVTPQVLGPKYRSPRRPETPRTRAPSPEERRTVRERSRIWWRWPWGRTLRIDGEPGPSSEATPALGRTPHPAPRCSSRGSLSPSSSNDDFRDFFFSLIAQKGVGPIASSQALAIMESDLLAAGILLEKTSGGVIRGRLYLPSGNPNNLFGRSVDIGSYGGAWQWLPRGNTTCEGTCP